MAPIEVAAPDTFAGNLARVVVYVGCTLVPLGFGVLAGTRWARAGRDAVRFHRSWCLAFVALLLVANAPLVGFHRDTLRGRAVVGVILSKQQIIGPDMLGHTQYSPFLMVRPAKGTPARDAPSVVISDVRRDDYERVDTGTRVWIRVVAGAPSGAHLGKSPAVDTMWGPGAVAVCLLGLLYWVRARRRSGKVEPVSPPVEPAPSAA